MPNPTHQGNTPLRVFVTNLVLTVVDALTGALLTISTVHHEVHEGETFFASYMSPEGSPIGDNQEIEILMLTGAKENHLTFIAAAGGDAEIWIGEDTVVDANGTELVAQNLKRNASNNSVSTVYHTPTNATSGTQLENILLPGGTGGNAGGGLARRDTEWIFKPNTQYIIRGINRSGSSKLMSLAVQWYEETPL